MGVKGMVYVVGCGVSGLTCGVILLEKGFGVKIVAHKVPPETTSDVAAAYWYPYKVSPRRKVLEWGSFSYRKFLELSEISRTGVSMVELVKLFDHKVETPFWEDAVRSFRVGKAVELPLDYTYAHIAEVPLIETPVYMKYLMGLFTELGGEIEKVDGKISKLSDLYSDKRIIINCTGLGARELCNDKEAYPIRGQIVRTTNPGLERILSDEEGPLSLCYIVPRTNDCILGGTAEEGNWSLEPDPKTAENILRKCRKLEPALNHAEVLERKVGLRPGRTEVRLELERVSEDVAVVHNYGHGGAGFTLSWGCAEEVAELVESFLNES